MNTPPVSENGQLVVGYSYFGGSNGRQVITRYIEVDNIDPDTHARQTLDNESRLPQWIQYFMKKPLEGDAGRNKYVPVSDLPTYFIDATLEGPAFPGHDVVVLRGGHNYITVATGSQDRVLLSLG